MFSKQVLKSLFSNTPVAYAYVDVLYHESQLSYDFKLVDFNPSFANIMEIDKEATGKPLNKIDDSPNLVSELSLLLNSLLLIGENNILSQCFEPWDKCFDIYIFPIKNNSLVVQVIDRTKEVQLANDLIRQTENLEYLSYHDKLTGLYNRAFFEEEMRRLDTERNLPISIIMGDINGLKIINDVFGHSAGDDLIISSANILSKSCRQEDIVARWGGDEFIILLPNTSSESALEIVNRIKDNFTRRKVHDHHINMSLGYSVKNHLDKSMAEVIKEAENLMYKNKSLEGQEVHKLIIDSMTNYLYEWYIEVKDHMDRLKKYSIKIGEILKLTKEDMDRLIIVCQIHDIGHISIDKNILSKIEVLTDEDWEEIKRHPEIGYRIAKSIPELADVANYILHHHERWDGSGYPHNLKGEDIPLLSRLFSVVDVFDAMTQDKAYRKAYSKEYAIEYIKNNAGKQFDPNIVDIFINKVYRK